MRSYVPLTFRPDARACPHGMTQPEACPAKRHHARRQEGETPGCRGRGGGRGMTWRRFRQAVARSLHTAEESHARGAAAPEEERCPEVRPHRRGT